MLASASCGLENGVKRVTVITDFTIFPLKRGNSQRCPPFSSKKLVGKSPLASIKTKSETYRRKGKNWFFCCFGKHRLEKKGSYSLFVYGIFYLVQLFMVVKSLIRLAGGDGTSSLKIGIKLSSDKIVLLNPQQDRLIF